jgi:pimeloyl-ACP methyl ester carboxylesterase
VVTLLHGFPTSSWDWASTAAWLEADHTVVTVDLLGYGDSDKPWKHTYSTTEHADIVESVWRALGVERPSAAFVEVPDAGHFPHIERPDVVARAIRENTCAPGAEASGAQQPHDDQREWGS